MYDKDLVRNNFPNFGVVRLAPFSGRRHDGPDFSYKPPCRRLLNVLINREVILSRILTTKDAEKRLRRHCGRSAIGLQEDFFVCFVVTFSVTVHRGQVHVFGRPFARKMRLSAEKWTSPRPTRGSLTSGRGRQFASLDRIARPHPRPLSRKRARGVCFH
jgi:hypothetical protein